MELLEQHQKLVELATDTLEPDPIAEFGEANLIEEAKKKTEFIYGRLDVTLLPTPTRHLESRSSPRYLEETQSIISDERYQGLLRRDLGEEWAALCNLPYKDRLREIADYQQNFDTPRDCVWPAEGYTGLDLP